MLWGTVSKALISPVFWFGTRIEEKVKYDHFFLCCPQEENDFAKLGLQRISMGCKKLQLFWYSFSTESENQKRLA